MKNSFFTLFVLLATINQLYAQSPLSAEAGSDVTVCKGYFDFDTVVIGTQTASGGYPPYFYRWYIEPVYRATGPWIYTEDIILDSTDANPTLYEAIDNSIVTLYLEVTDSMGQTAIDSTTIYTSKFTQNAQQAVYYIAGGDTLDVGIAVGDGGLGERQYLWRPNHGLIDSTEAALGRVSPSQPLTKYYCITTDSLGCTDTSGLVVWVYVSPDDIRDLKESDGIEIFPNPVFDEFRIRSQNPSEILEWQLISSNGQVLRTEGYVDQKPISIQELSAGTYFIILRTQDAWLRKSLVKL